MVSPVVAPDGEGGVGGMEDAASGASSMKAVSDLPRRSMTNVLSDRRTTREGPMCGACRGQRTSSQRRSINLSVTRETGDAKHCRL